MFVCIYYVYVLYASGKSEERDRVELIEIIQGKTSIELGAIHHIEIQIDINEFGENRDSFKSFVDKVTLEDCPGFDSPYKFSEGILYEYIEKASYTFYLMPANDFGGINEVRRLTNLRQRTTTMIPLISKADLIEDEEEKEDISKRFAEILSGKFENQVANFISTFKYKEFKEKNQALNDKFLLGQKITEEEREDVNNLFRASGINVVFSEMAKCSAESELNDKKIAQIQFGFNEVVDSLRKAAITEQNYWKKELDKINKEVKKHFKQKFCIDNDHFNLPIFNDDLKITLNNLKNNIDENVKELFDYVSTGWLDGKKFDPTKYGQDFYDKYKKEPGWNALIYNIQAFHWLRLTYNENSLKTMYAKTAADSIQKSLLEYIERLKSAKNEICVETPMVDEEE